MTPRRPTFSWRHAIAWTAVLAVGLLVAGNPQPRPALPAVSMLAGPAAPHSADFGGAPVPVDVRAVADWAVLSNDHGGRPFAEIDKKAARIYIFSGKGRLIGDAAVLVGSTRGDDTVPGVGRKAIADVGPDERTTPAGRFVATPGTDTLGHRVVWVDYDAGVAMHAVVTAVAAEHRLERLASPDPARHRISYGCINLPTQFFADVAAPAFASRGGIVYILPEVRAVADVFPGLAAMASRRDDAPLLARAQKS